MSEFFAMGGYAIYLWPSYAVFLVVLFGAWGTAVWRGRRIRQAILRDRRERDRS